MQERLLGPLVGTMRECQQTPAEYRKKGNVMARVVALTKPGVQIMLEGDERIHRLRASSQDESRPLESGLWQQSDPIAMGQMKFNAGRRWAIQPRFPFSK
jgi:hypothetical protein